MGIIKVYQTEIADNVAQDVHDDYQNGRINGTQYTTELKARLLGEGLKYEEAYALSHCVIDDEEAAEIADRIFSEAVESGEL